MTEQERINAETQMKLALQDAKFNSFVQEMNEFRAEMRDRDNQRAAEIRDRDNQRAEDIREIRASFQSMQNILQDMQASGKNLNIVTILGVAAIVIAVLLK